MKQETGNPKFPIWLLGDSEPDRWKNDLDTPFDPRHPIRHNIWTSIIDIVQDKLYRRLRERMDTENLYIRNAIKNAADKPTRYQKEWHEIITQNIHDLNVLIT